MPLLEARNVSKRFGRAAPLVLKDVNLACEQGESVAIVGESGSGKTTLARILLGLETPTNGEVYFDGRRLPSGGKAWRDSRRHLQMIPQYASAALDPRMTIRGHFTEVISAHGLAGADERDDLIRARLEEVRLDPACMTAYPRRLSGGQQQRVVIARGLLVEPRVLVSDEPTSALDPLTQERVISLLAARCVSDDRLFAIITHDLRVARKLCTRILVMRNGEIVEDGDAEQVFEHPAHPYTRELLAATSMRRNRDKAIVPADPRFGVHPAEKSMKDHL